MTIKMRAAEAGERYSLTIRSYPDDQVIPSVCKIIYDCVDRNLLAVLSEIPYTVGRRFELPEAERIHKELQRLDVGHRFQSANDSSKVMEYLNPSEIPAPPPAPLLKEKSAKVIPFPWQRLQGRLRTKFPIPFFSFRLESSRKLLVHKKAGIIFLGSVLGAALLAWSWSSISASGSKLLGFLPSFSSASNSDLPSAPKVDPALTLGEHQALLEKFQREVEFKRSKDFLWKKVEPHLVFEQLDSIRTYAQSLAVLRFKEGSRLTIKENTLLVVGENMATPDHRQVQLEDGSIQTRLQPSDRTRTLSIKTSSGTLELESPKHSNAAIPAADTQVKASVHSGQLEVAVTEGKAVLRPPQKDAAPIEVSRLQKITATPEKVSPVTAYVPEIELIKPIPDERFQIDPQRAMTFEFEWEGLGAPGTRYFLKLASDPEMKTILLSQEVSDPKISLSYLDIGTLYWQVSALTDGTEYQSQPRRLYVEKKPQH